MCSFNYGGQSYETLDYSVMSSTPRRSYTEGTKSFNSRAEQEMRELEPEDYKHPFINVYSESGYVYTRVSPKRPYGSAWSARITSIRQASKK